jgi:hypothetical protein
MDSSSLEFPRWVFHWNGHERIVENREELAVLQGYQHSYSGPWPRPLPWDVRGGPFAPELTHQSEHYPPGGPMAVYATRALIYNRRARSPGEVFLLEGRIEDRELLAEKMVQQYPSGISPRFRHEGTGRWFVDETVLEPYAQCYERDDIVRLGFEDPQQARNAVGRPPDAAWRTWSLEDLTQLLAKAMADARRKHPSKRWPSLEDVADCAGYSRQFLSKAFEHHNLTWTQIRPLLGK